MISAMPAAAEYPVRNSLGQTTKGPEVADGARGFESTLCANKNKMLMNIAIC
jgi:hypothetical protein